MRLGFVNFEGCTDRIQGAELLDLGIPENTAGGVLYGQASVIPSWSLAELLSLLPVCFIVEAPDSTDTSTHSLFIYSFEGMWHCGYSVIPDSNILLRTRSQRLADAVVELFKTLANAGYDFRRHFASEASTITMDGDKFCGTLFVGSKITFLKNYGEAEENHGDDSI